MHQLNHVSDALAIDFPFVEELPKQKQKKVLSLWETLEEYRKLVEENGPPVSFTHAAKLLGVSRQRIYDLAENKRFKVITSPDGVSVITANSLALFAQQERKAGRPTKLHSSLRGKAFLSVIEK